MIIILLCIVVICFGVVVYLLFQGEGDAENLNVGERIKRVIMPSQGDLNRQKVVFNCPSCGAEIGLLSKFSVYAVCKYCHSMVVRHDVNVDSIGTMANLPEDMSPIQIGTEGSYESNRFFVIGRVKIGWEDGVWNEWFITSTDGRRGWLAEAQGFYAVCFEEDHAQSVETQLMPKLGSYLELNKQKFKVVDIKKATCIGSEGELPFRAVKGFQMTAIDLLGPSGEFASIELEDGKSRIYIGNYVEWDDLHFQNVRPLESW